MNENASAVSAWDTGLPGLLTLGKDGLPKCWAGGDHLYRLYRNSATIAPQVDDVFVHYSAIVGRMVGGTFESMVDKFRNLKEGERVEFVIEDTPKGPQASDVVEL
jgi:cold shock CspA family protein